ncbi:hypothetical protein PVAP13_9KG196600 [Panicum virgatum]|uniref:Alpha-ketoglutarate-dependent dioxygenase AlkB-like domain-containing protein n=1 Tax=Panicum virgatum TaxID=38727 RepID=A0A8T0NQH2_PANVG|nr:hypothetical protein PVAP13_9KG196600 [Panicum virgatum]
MEDTTTQEAAAAAAERPSSALALRSLADYTVGAIPTLFYVPDFISNSEQSQLLHHIYQAPAPKWKSLKNRRLQNWGGVVHEKGLLPQALPSWLTRITDRICQWTGLFPSAINHVLINEYHPNQGIMIDELTGPAKMESNGSGSHERGATNESDPACSSLMLMPCSLLIFKDQAYTDYLHGIQDNELHNLDKVKNLLRCPELKHLSSDSIQGSMDKQRGTFRRTATRVSLTCRLVLKVHKKLFKI